MEDTQRRREIAGQAQTHLTEDILPFWFPHAVDESLGGCFTCFDNKGNLLAKDKYTWSQGRFIALCAQLASASRRGKLDLDEEKMTVFAVQTAKFVKKYALKEDFTTVYRTNRIGKAIGDVPHSIYADSFAAIGWAELAKLIRSKEWLELAEKTLESVKRSARTGKTPTAPYQMPEEAKIFGVRMIVLNAELVVARARRELGLQVDLDAMSQAVQELLELWTEGHGALELWKADLPVDSLLMRHRTPGHALESLWMIEAAREYCPVPSSADLADFAIEVCELGWDPKYGGIFRYVDYRGGVPEGTSLGYPYEELVRRTWDTKLWWVHSEAAVSLSVLSSKVRGQAIKNWRDEIWNYTTSTFPTKTPGNEWIQIRDRQAQPLNEVVALPVKDPYHLIRNLLQLMEL